VERAESVEITRTVVTEQNEENEHALNVLNVQFKELRLQVRSNNHKGPNILVHKGRNSLKDKKADLLLSRNNNELKLLAHKDRSNHNVRKADRLHSHSSKDLNVYNKVRSLQEVARAEETRVGEDLKDPDRAEEEEVNQPS